MFSLILPLLAVFHGPSVPTVAERTLEELVRFSDRIVVGRVERVVEVPRARPLLQPTSSGDMFGVRPSVPVAEVVVERTLHGPPATRVHFLACGTWTCDTSGAEVGDRVLLFLADTRWMSEECDDFLDALAELSGGAPVYKDAHSGRGYMPLREVDGETFANLWSGDVILPDSIPTIDDPAEEYEWMRSAPLELLERFVTRTSARVLPRLHASSRSATTAAPLPEFDVWTWADGVSSLDARPHWIEGRPVAYALARAGAIAAEPGFEALRAGAFEAGDAILSYLDDELAWTVTGSGLTSNLEEQGSPLPLVLRLRAHWTALGAIQRQAEAAGR